MPLLIASQGQAAAAPSEVGSTATCAQWNIAGAWVATQSNTSIPLGFTFTQKGTKVTGTATFGNLSGPVKGSLVGHKLRVLVVLGSAEGRYTATVTSGHMKGKTHQVGNPSNKATWTATGPTTCTS